ncbi:MAG TPA: site-2 protease family protein [Gaiellaceae bacterium]|nr:site-2 protease family protein [Gaiellaceae bacterium]
MNWAIVIFGLVLIVVVHELGHFTMALAVGIRPRSFYIGFPPALVKMKRKGIEYGIGAIPLGGLVRIPGMHKLAGSDVTSFIGPAMHEDATLVPTVQRIRRLVDAEDYAGARAALPELESELDRAVLTPSAKRSAERAVRELEEGTGGDAYWRQPAYKRILVIGAGPAANILCAMVIFFAVYATGAPSGNASTKVGEVEAGMPAAVAGLQPGDRVVAVDGRTTPTFDRISAAIRASHGRPITLTVDRGGRTLTLGPEKTVRSGGRWIWGFVPAATLAKYSVGHSARLAVADCWHVVTGTVAAFTSIFHGHPKGQLTSTVGIVRISAAALKVSFGWYLQIVALVSLSVALLNLLPLLPLDGGHILFTMIETIRRRALAREVYERVSVVGFALIMLLMVIAFSTGNNPQ